MRSNYTDAGVRCGRSRLCFGKNEKKRGAIDFDFPEAKVILDEKGVPTEIRAV